ncbi:MAG TPA: nuclear transport factor 2 family protein [Kofleriaceae bacterium]|nr:nuclear transport factor 2 family protein [Kofleriaceae bacterium]
MTTDPSPLALIESIYAAFGRGDVATILGHTTADAVYDFAGGSPAVPWHGPWRGHDGVTTFFTRLGETVEFETFTPLAFAAGGDAVAVRLHLRYRIRATGRVVDEQQVHWWTLRGGKVAALRHFEDTAQVIAAAT